MSLKYIRFSITYHLHNRNRWFNRSQNRLHGFEQCQKVVNVHDDMHIQIQDHNEQFHVTGADLDCQP